MKLLLLLFSSALLVAACAVDTGDDEPSIESATAIDDRTCEPEIAEQVDLGDGEYEASAFTCSPCPPFALGRSICCIYAHVCCPGS